MGRQRQQRIEWQSRDEQANIKEVGDGRAMMMANTALRYNQQVAQPLLLPTSTLSLVLSGFEWDLEQHAVRV